MPIMAKSVSEVEAAVTRLGWGWYQNYVTLACGCVRPTQGWAADNMVMLSASVFMNEMTEEWDLTDTQTGAIGTMSVLGILLGTCTFGYLSDRLGRAYIFKRTLIISATAAGVLAFAVNYAMAVVFMMLMGFGVGGDIIVAGTAFTEFCPTNKRWVLALLATTWNLGSCITVGLAWLLVGVKVDFVHMWRVFSVIIAGILLLFWLVRLPMDESPKFLALKGKYEEAQEVINKIALKNGLESATMSFSSIQPLAEHQSKSGLSRFNQVKQLFRRPYLRTTLILSPVWFLISSAYVTNSLFMPELLKKAGHGSESDEETYMTMFFQQIAGIPGIFLATWMVETRMGRRWTQAVALLLSGLCVFLFLIALDYWMIMVTSTLMFFFSLMAYSAQYTITPESYPTEIRSTGMGWCSAMSRIAGVLTPVVVGALFSLEAGREIVLAICVAFFGVGGLLAALLRETRGKVIE